MEKSYELNSLLNQECDKNHTIFCVNELNKNPKRYFKAQRKLINAQIKSTNSFFRELFKGKDFKTEARKYFKERGLI